MVSCLKFIFWITKKARRQSEKDCPRAETWYICKYAPNLLHQTAVMSVCPPPIIYEMEFTRLPSTATHFRLTAVLIPAAIHFCIASVHRANPKIRDTSRSKSSFGKPICRLRIYFIAAAISSGGMCSKLRRDFSSDEGTLKSSYCCGSVCAFQKKTAFSHFVLLMPIVENSSSNRLPIRAPIREIPHASNTRLHNTSR